MAYRIALYGPDRGQVYDGRTPEQRGIGGGISARVSLVGAMAAAGHDVVAYVNCAEPLVHAGVRYVPLDDCTRIDCDVLIAISTGGALSFAPLRAVEVHTRLRVLWVQGVPEPADIEAVGPDVVAVASNFLREVCVQRWGVDASRIFVCYNGLDQALFEAAAADATTRDPLSLAYIGPPAKGLDAAVAILRHLRAADPRYHLDVLGGAALWGEPEALRTEPGLRLVGLLGQTALVRALFGYEYCLAPQAMEEGFGIAVQEAKRAGLIVVASRVGAFAETIRSSHDGFLIDGSHQAADVQARFADRILRLQHDPALRARIRANAMRTPWSWTLAARSWTAFLEHVLATPSEARRPSFIELPDGFHSLEHGTYVPTVYPASPMFERAGERTHVLLGGYVGHGNVGDEAILRETLEGLRRADPAVRVTVVSGNPEQTRQTHDVDAVHERDWPALVDAARQSDLVVLGGGGLFQDYHGVDERTLLSRVHWGLTYFAAFPALAAMLGKPFALHAVGAGPLTSDAGRRLTMLIAERANSITVRDEASRAALADCGVDVSRAQVTADPAFLVQGSGPERGRQLAAAAGVPEGTRHLAAVSVRHWDRGVDPADWHRSVADALDRLVDVHGATLLFVPMQASAEDALTDDGAAAAAVAARMRRLEAVVVLPAPLDAPELHSLFSACDFVVAMRLHAAILAAAAHTPFLALAYDPKVRATVEALGVPDAAADFGSTASAGVRLSDVLDAAFVSRAGMADHLARVVPAMRLRAAGNTTPLIDLLKSRPSPAPLSSEWNALLQTTLLERVLRAEAMESRADELDAYARSLQAAAAVAPTSGDRGEATRDPRPSPAGEAGGSQPAPSHDDMVRRLEARTQELVLLGTQLAAARTELLSTPGYEWRQRQRSIVLALRTVRRRIGRIGRLVLGPAVSVLASAARLLVPAALRARIVKRLTRGLMSPEAFIFDRFKRERARRYGADLAALRVPFEPGLVSVVLPAYNGASMMREAIETTLAQTYRAIELLIVDDGSTDETLQVAQEYAARDSRVRVIAQDHRRLPRTLSNGFRHTRGEFLTWTSCDNRMRPAYLEQMVGALRRHPGWDMTYANLDLIGEDGEPLRNTTYYDPYQTPARSEHIHLPASVGEMNTRANNSVGAAFLYRRRVAALLGDYSRHRFVMEDYDYWMRVNALLTLRHADFDEPLYEYRFHTMSLTSRWDEFDMLGNRERMMVFEEGRRDLYLSPMVWMADATRSPEATALLQCAGRAGHVVYSGAFPPDELAGVPVVYVGTAAGSPPALVPPGTLRVLLAGDGVLPDTVAPAWDMCCALGERAALPRLPIDYQGWFAAADAQTLFQAIDVRAKAAYVERLEAQAEEPDTPELRASVVVCTHAFGDGVFDVLRAVATQRIDADDYELIVVDNRPAQEALRDAVARLRTELFAGRADRLRLASCPVPGLSHARNAGIAVARGRIVCFVDDDAVPASTWLNDVCRAFEEHPETGVVGGPITLRVPEPRPDAVRRGWEKYWSEYVPEVSGYTEMPNWRGFPWGANWSARRVVLRQMCGFRSRYGRVGENFWGGEEMVAAALAQRLGYRIAVIPAAVEHRVVASRFSVDHVRRTMTAGLMVSYFARRDRYLPGLSGEATAVQEFFTGHVDAAVKDVHTRWLDIWFRKLAQARVLGTVAADLWRRAKRGYVDER